MYREMTLRFSMEDAKELAYLSASVGFPPEMAAIYAIRLVSACVHEGLFADISLNGWPEAARIEGLFDTGTGGKVLAFKRNQKDEDSRV